MYCTLTHVHFIAIILILIFFHLTVTVLISMKKKSKTKQHYIRRQVRNGGGELPPAIFLGPGWNGENATHNLQLTTEKT